LATKIGGPNSNDLIIKVGEPPSFDGGVRMKVENMCKMGRTNGATFGGQCAFI